jgi:hypothetical protein
LFSFYTLQNKTKVADLEVYILRFRYRGLESLPFIVGTSKIVSLGYLFSWMLREEIPHTYSISSVATNTLATSKSLFSSLLGTLQHSYYHWGFGEFRDLWNLG